MSSPCDVAIVGAGPYGLAAAAYLRAADGLDVRVFGEPMGFWRRRMPRGMLLRSPWEASHIADPDGALTLDRYEAESGSPIPRPVPLDRFVDYGLWFQQAAVPGVDPRGVERIEKANGAFSVSLGDGDELGARRVVVAAGIAPFARRPAEFEGLPPDRVSHSSEHDDFAELRDRSVAVVGGGQSALESAALLAEAGARPEVIVRAPRVNWLVRSSWLHRFGPVKRLLYAPADIGPAGVSWIVATPGCFKRLPLSLQAPVADRSIRPAASGWLIPRLEGVPITTGRSVVSAAAGEGGVTLVLDDGTRRTVDHVVLATGYGVDVSRYGFLSGNLLASLRVCDGYPELSPAFESSVPGLHFVGACAARSFGPLTRFVAGTGYAARAVTRAVVGRRR